jgi:hypothetical protein
MKEVTMKADGDETYGARVYDELRRLTGFNLLAQELDYAAIQELKSADRAGTARLLAAGVPELMRRIEVAEPAEFVSDLIREVERLRQDAAHAATRTALLLALLKSQI